MEKVVSYIIFFSFFGATAIFAQTATMDEVHLFQSFYFDAPIHSAPYGETTLDYSNFKTGSVFGFGVKAGIPVSSRVELVAGLPLRIINPDQGDSRSGIADIPVAGRYNFVGEQKTKLSGGAFLTLPVGTEDIGGGYFHFGFFGAVRHTVSDNVALTSALSLASLERRTTLPGQIVYGPYLPIFTPVRTSKSRETSLGIGAGTIFKAADKLHLVGELRIETQTDFTVLSGGVDHEISDRGRIRGNLLLGVDNGAPDFGLTGGVLFTF